MNCWICYDFIRSAGGIALFNQPSTDTGTDSKEFVV